MNILDPSVTRILKSLVHPYLPTSISKIYDDFPGNYNRFKL